MRRVIWILLLVGLALALAWWVAFLPGTVSASAFGYTVETITPIAVVAVAVAVLLLLLLLRVLLGLLGLPGAARFWNSRRRRRAGDAAVGHALVALAAGDAPKARRESRRARDNLGDTPQTLLLAAEAARLAGNQEQAKECYEALLAQRDGAFLGLRGLFRQAVEREDWKQADALARRAEALQPGGNWLRDARLRLAEETGDWSRAMALSGPGLPEEVVATAAAGASADPESAARYARLAYRANPGFVPAVVAHAAALRRQGREAKAEEVVVEAWRSAPHPDLAAFLLERETNPKARLSQAVRLSNANAEHLETQYLLARLSLDAGELREARFHAERARSLATPTRRIHVLMADLAAAEGKDPTPELREAAMAPADPAWRCGQCGAVHREWHPVCPSCHAPGRIGWQEPGVQTGAATLPGNSPSLLTAS